MHLDLRDSPIHEGPTLIVPKLTDKVYTSPFASQEFETVKTMAPSRSSAFKPISKADKEDREWEPKEEVVRERARIIEDEGDHKKPAASYARLIASVGIFFQL